MKSPTSTRPDSLGSTRSAFKADPPPAPADVILHFDPKSITNLFNISEPTISGTNLASEYVEQLQDVNLRFPVSADGRPLCEVTVLVDNIPFYVRDECLNECNRTIMRYMVAEAFLTPRD